MAFPATFQDIQNAVILKARLDSTLDLANVKDWINRAYAQVCVETEANVVADTMTLTSGTSSYTLPAGIARIKQMVVKPAGSTQYNPPMIRTTLDEILNRRQFGGDTSSTTSGAIIPQSTHYAVVGLNQFEIWPTPSAADVITLWLVALPTALSANGDVPILQEPYSSHLLEYGALVHAGDFKGDPATADWQNSYGDWMARYIDHLKQRPGDIPGQFHQWGDGQWSGWSQFSGAY